MKISWPKALKKNSLGTVKLLQLRALCFEYTGHEGPTDSGFSAASLLPNYITSGNSHFKLQYSYL